MISTPFTASTTTTSFTFCANCDTGETDECKLKTCTACKAVKYCCRDCQVSHRRKHKRACKKRAAELFEEELFKDHPEREECPICMLPFTGLPCDLIYQLCCGKFICKGCYHAKFKEDVKSGKRGRQISACPFCRADSIDQADDESVALHIKKWMENNNAYAMGFAANHYLAGSKGFPRDAKKAMELLLKAGELGNDLAHCKLGDIYDTGTEVEKDVNKARHYWGLAAIGGNLLARFNLGVSYSYAADIDRAFKHFMIGAKAGHEESLTALRNGCKTGLITKNEYTEGLLAYQKHREDVKSIMRDEAPRYQADISLYWK